MTYQDFISLVNREVRDSRAWPNDTSKLQEQLDLAYVATLSVAIDIPTGRFALSNDSLSGTAIGTSATEEFDLPADVFDDRDDLGIHNIVINGVPRWPFESIRVDSVLRSGGNPFADDKDLFSIDLSGRKIFANNATTLSLNYIPRPEKPTDQNYTSSGNYPLKEKDAQRAVHIVAAHLSGVQIRDNASATFHSMLEQTYR